MRAARTIAAGVAILTVAVGGWLAGTYWADNAQTELIQRTEAAER